MMGHMEKQIRGELAAGRTFGVRHPSDRWKPIYWHFHATLEGAIDAARASSAACANDREIFTVDPDKWFCEPCIEEGLVILAKVRWVPGHTEVEPTVQSWVLVAQVENQPPMYLDGQHRSIIPSLSDAAVFSSCAAAMDTAASLVTRAGRLQPKQVG